MLSYTPCDVVFGCSPEGNTPFISHKKSDFLLDIRQTFGIHLTDIRRIFIRHSADI